MSTLTDEMRIAFEANGYLVLRGALQGDDLTRVQAAAEEAEAAWRADPHRLGTRSAALHQVQAPIEYDDALLELLWYPGVFPLVRTLLGDDVAMIDNDLFLTPPNTPHTHADWHHDVGMPGIYHPRSLVMLKVFYLLSDVGSKSGGTALIPGSHRFPMDFPLPTVQDPKAMPGAIQMTGSAGDAYLFNCRIYHCAVNNESDHWRRVLIYNYGHHWMKPWSGYEPSERLRRRAVERGDPVEMQLLHLGDAYGATLR